MTLAFVLFHYFPYGGLQRDFRRVLEACRRRGMPTRIYAMAWQGEVPAGSELQLFPGTALTRPGRQRQFARYLAEQRKAGAFDCLIGFNRLPGLDYYFAADSCFADKAARRSLLYRLSPRARSLLAFEEAVFGQGADTRILLLSPLQAAQYQRHYNVLEERLALLPPGIAEDRRAGPDAAALRAACRREFGLSENALLVLQLGSGFRVKGVDRALRAIAAQAPALRADLHYLLVGQDRAAPYLRLARRLGISDRVRILPGRDDVPRLLQGADLLLHPARSESAGLVLLEAVVAGLPVLTTASCGYAFHVQRAGAGQVCAEPFEQSGLNARLAAMLGDQAARRRWRAAGLAYGASEDLYAQAERVAALISDPGAWAQRPSVPREASVP